VEKPSDRVHGSISLALSALGQGVQVFRVHDVAETRQAFDLWEAVNFGE
jgi:dihydropteroate synthase